MKAAYTLTLFAILTLVVSCTAQNASIKPLSIETTTISSLVKDWENYHVFSGSRDGIRPTALVFAPKVANTRIDASAWEKIMSSESLSATLNQIHNWRGNFLLKELKGNGDKFFGYIYYPSNTPVPLRMADSNTMKVLRLPQPIPSK
ncbi:MAG: hypothetical protein MI892_29750 [Desulfobacterales bacterium]|nr:hypothetical protein [Desulfobacterales bacterium]